MHITQVFPLMMLVVRLSLICLVGGSNWLTSLRPGQKQMAITEGQVGSDPGIPFSRLHDQKILGSHGCIVKFLLYPNTLALVRELFGS